MADKLMEEIKQSIKELVEFQKDAERRQKEADRRQKEADRRQKEMERMFQESKKEADHRHREMNKLFEGQWGKLMESLVEGDLVELLRGKGIEVDMTLQNLKKKKNGEEWELDIVAINGKEVVVVEVKTTMKVKDVDRFVNRTLENFIEKIFPEYKDKTVYGAMAYLREDEHSAKHAQRPGVVRDQGHRFIRQYRQR